MIRPGSPAAISRHLARQHERPSQICIDDRVDQLQRHPMRPLSIRDRGIVDENRYGSECPLGAVQRVVQPSGS
jgi:hypothetical protein